MLFPYVRIGQKPVQTIPDRQPENEPQAHCPCALRFPPSRTRSLPMRPTISSVPNAFGNIGLLRRRHTKPVRALLRSG